MFQKKNKNDDYHLKIKKLNDDIMKLELNQNE